MKYNRSELPQDWLNAGDLTESPTGKEIQKQYQFLFHKREGKPKQTKQEDPTELCKLITPFAGKWGVNPD